MKKSFKIASAAVLCTVFALTLTFCGSKPAETADVDTVATEPTPVVDTTAVDTTATATDTTAAQ